MHTPLPPDFYIDTDVTRLARALLGKVLVTHFDGVYTSGIITETEAYRAPDDRACHAYGNLRTARTEVMFQEGGRAYVYLCYGIHHLFNVVTGPADTAHAVLIRGIEPLEGLEHMLQRRGGRKITAGPGVLTQALGLHTGHSGKSLLDPAGACWITSGPRGEIAETDIGCGPRIGVDYAGECAAWPWRFWIKNNPYVKK